MKKTLRNIDIVNIVNRIEAMQKREEENHEKILKDCIKVNYAIIKNKEKLLDLLKPYNESREQLLNECKSGEPDASGTVRIRKDCMGKWNDGMKELQEIEVEADIHMVKFATVEKLGLSMNDLEAISFMTEDPEGFE